jgi:hypothetical protein
MISTTILAIALAGQAAASQPTPMPTPTAAPFTIGTTTYQTVIDQLGRPSATSALGDGTKVIVYMSSRTKVKGASYVPIVGLFAGGAKSRMVIRTFTFGPDGLLQNYSTTDASADCSAGLLGAKCK